jgi:inosose dehydratase
MAFEEPRVLGEQLAGLNALLDVFDAVDGSKLAPRPTLAGAGSPGSRLTRSEDRPRRSDEEWRRFADGVSAALEACRSRGYEPTFHHHVGSRIETSEEIERLLALTDVSLCLDSGHLAVCGGDPVQAIRDWSARINHVHVKDADMAAVDALVARRAAVEDLFRREVFTPLGHGQLNCEAFLRELRATGYAGWIVVEQDIYAPRGDRIARAQSDQERSLVFLREHGF